MKREKQRIWHIPIEYKMKGTLEIPSNTFEEAEKLSKEMPDLPKDAEYIEGSVETDYDHIDCGYYEDEEIDHLEEKYGHLA